MQRRLAIQSILTAPAAAKIAATTGALGLAAQTIAAPAPALGGPDFPLLEEIAPDAAGEGIQRFFSDSQFPAIAHAADLIFPSVNGMPGALASETPLFIDFLLTQSSSQRKKLFRDGADKLNVAAQAKSGKPFAALSAADSATILAPLKDAWTYDPPPDPFAHFLRELKADVFRGVGNSRETAEKQPAGRRRGTGLNTYWHGLD